MEKVGATDLNGTTSEDRTNYFENVPDAGPRPGPVDGVRPHGPPARAPSPRPSSTSSAAWCRTRSARARTSPTAIADELIAKSTLPGRPSLLLDGDRLMEDLSAATLEDVQEWFKTYYGAANAVIVVAGDIDARRRPWRRSRSTSATSRPARRSPGTRPGSPSAPATQRQVVQDRVPQARLYKVWNVPPYGTPRATCSTWRATCSGRGQDLAALQAPGLRRPDRHRRQRLRRQPGDRRPVHHPGRLPSPAWSWPGGEGHRRGAGRAS